MRLTVLDIAVLVAYFVVTTFIGFWVGRKERATTRDYFLAGSQIPWYAIGFSIAASSISTEQFIGEVGMAYQQGLSVANFEWFNFPALTILIWLFIPLYIRGRVTTMPEFLERRYGIVPRGLFAALSVLTYVLVNLALVFYGGAAAMQFFFPNLNMLACVIALAVATGTYTIYGGLASVVWTDVFQCVLLLVGGLLVFVLGALKVDGGWAAIVSTGARGHLVLPASNPDLPWTALPGIVLSTNIWYFCNNQYINQRCLAAKDEWHAKMGVVFYAFMGVVIGLCVVFPGFIAYAINPAIKDPNQVYPYLVMNVLPPSLRGLILAALIGAVMSTVSSLVNSTATVFSLDIYQRLFRRDASEAQLIRAGRIAGAAALLVGVACTPLVGHWQTIFSYSQEIWVLVAGPTVAVFVVGVLWRRATNAAATFVMALSFPLIAVPFIQKSTYPIFSGQLANMYVLGFFVLIGCVLLMIVASLITRPTRNAEVDRLQWSPAMLRLPGETAALRPHWYQSVAFWWALMIGCFGAIYACLW